MNDRKSNSFPSSSAVDAVAESLSRVSDDVNLTELRLLLRSYSHVDYELQAERFVRWWQGTGNDNLRSLTPFETFLSNAKPAPSPNYGGKSKALSEEEIGRRVAYHRRLIEDTVVLGERYFRDLTEHGVRYAGADDIEQECNRYRKELEKRR